MVQIFNISSTAPFVIKYFWLSFSTTTESLLLLKSKGISSIFLNSVTKLLKSLFKALCITASSILPFKPVWKYEFKNACFKTLIFSFPYTSKYFSNTILSSVKVTVLSVNKMFIAPKFCIESNFFTIVFFLDILTAPFERQEDKITGSKSGVIVIAIATAKVNASTVLCFW